MTSCEVRWSSLRIPSEVMSSVYASLASLSSSTRNLVLACFRCQGKHGCCFRKENVNGDRAWFDCEQVQDHPYCYVNPVATLDERRLPGNVPFMTSPSGNLFGDVIDGLGTSPLVNGFADKTEVKNMNDGYANPSKPNGALGLSFASKMEADREHNTCDVDNQRREGEVCPARVVASGMTSAPVCNSPILKRKKYLLEDTLGPEDNEDDIWRTDDPVAYHEKNKLYSYDASMGISFWPAKPKANIQKFQEFYPSGFSTIGNTKLKVDPLIQQSPIEDQKKTFVSYTEHISKSDLIKFLKMCIYAKRVEDINNFSHSFNNATCNNNNFRYGKSFNKTLVFDLVKEVMLECQIEYSNSISCSNAYPCETVQNKVLNILEDHKLSECDDNFVSREIREVRNKLLTCSRSPQKVRTANEMLVENIIRDELRKEDKMWKNIENDEFMVKEAVTKDIWNDILEFETSCVCEVLLTKWKLLTRT